MFSLAAKIDARANVFIDVGVRDTDIAITTKIDADVIIFKYGNIFNFYIIRAQTKPDSTASVSINTCILDGIIHRRP